jgi:hypothetical protein
MSYKSLETQERMTARSESPKALSSPTDNPAGTISMSGRFVNEHKQEILELVRTAEEGHRSAHPEGHLIDIKEEEDGTVVIKFTSAALARAIGETLYRTYWGELDTTYTDQREKVYITWWC